YTCGSKHVDKILLLQTVLVGKAQEALVALPTTERKNYQCVKDAVLKCYELIPEAYRQRFRNWRKSDRQTHAEIARELSSFFHRWCTAEGISNFDDLCDLVILEQFKNILPERIATYVGEHQVRTAAQAAVLADNFVADPVLQVVVPEKYRNLVLKTAHGEMTGHYGVKKTYSHLLQHFYWPRIKCDVAKFIKECHICQIAGKPNVSIKPAPLHPIPSVGT
uniref:Gypsy retrotransposon integrase-like protein 1 n=1 Tax=Cyprinus carpio carpio TaxID=630221 RepID=A0A9J8CPB7_CYPCA